MGRGVWSVVGWEVEKGWGGICLRWGWKEGGGGNGRVGEVLWEGLRGERGRRTKMEGRERGFYKDSLARGGKSWGENGVGEGGRKEREGSGR